MVPSKSVRKTYLASAYLRCDMTENDERGPGVTKLRTEILEG